MKSSSTTAETGDARAAARGGDPCSRVEEALIAFFGDVCHRLGLPKSFGLIYGLAFVARRPLSFDDVVAGLRLSKGSASQGIRWLRERNILKPAKLPRANGNGHARREFFVPVTDVAELLQIIVRERFEFPLEAGRVRLNQLREIIDGTEPEPDGPSRARVNHLRRRLRRLESWHRATSRLAPRLARLAT